jgi:hypothetical protein
MYFEAIWYIFPRFGILDQEKSGNPDNIASICGVQGLNPGKVALKKIAKSIYLKIIFVPTVLFQVTRTKDISGMAVSTRCGTSTTTPTVCNSSHHHNNSSNHSNHSSIQ